MKSGQTRGSNGYGSRAEPRTYKVWKQSESGRTPEVPLHALLLPALVCVLSHASDHSSAIFKNKYRGWQGSKELAEVAAINGAISTRFTWRLPRASPRPGGHIENLSTFLLLSMHYQHVKIGKCIVVGRKLHDDSLHCRGIAAIKTA